MTALMVLFLLAMAVALTEVTKQIREIENLNNQLKNRIKLVDKIDDLEIKIQKEGDRTREIDSCLADIAAITKKPEFAGVTVHGHYIDFGKKVLFPHAEHDFKKFERNEIISDIKPEKENSTEQEHLIRAFVPQILDLARNQKCKKWLKRVVVEGFASQTGEYLYNLNLSYLRSQRVLCVLLNSKAPDAIPEKDRELIQRLFLVGGSSFNTAAISPEMMRRVEFKLEFRELDNAIDSKDNTPINIPLDPGLKCPNDLR
jgi:hypothetical protein